MENGPSETKFPGEMALYIPRNCKRSVVRWGCTSRAGRRAKPTAMSKSQQRRDGRESPRAHTDPRTVPVLFLSCHWGISTARFSDPVRTKFVMETEAPGGSYVNRHNNNLETVQGAEEATHARWEVCVCKMRNGIEYLWVSTISTQNKMPLKAGWQEPTVWSRHGGVWGDWGLGLCPLGLPCQISQWLDGKRAASG